MYKMQRLKFSVLAAVAAGFGLTGPLPVASAQSARGNITTWSVQVNTPDWNKNLGVTGARQGCSSSPAVCVDNVRKIAQTSSVRATLVVPLNATTTATDATQYSQLSLNAPFLQEVGIDDFVDQYTALSRVSPQPATVVNTVIANLKSANPALKFGGTIYDDQFTSAYLQDARLPAATRAQFDYVHLFVHFRQDGLNFEQSVQQAKQLFPNALIIAGAYAYDRRAYLACTPGGAACTTQQDLDLFSQTLTIQAQLLASKTVDSIEFYPGYFGNEEKWTGWSNPRECAPGDLASCIANTKAMRQAALTILGAGSPPTGTPRTTINTIAGNGGTDYSGDNGAATSAQIYGPTSVAYDNFGNVYVVDAGNSVVRRVDSKGVIHTFAGSKTADNSCVGGRPTSVGLDHPQGVAVDSAANVYIADAACAMVFKVDAAGKALTIVAGSSSPTSTGTGDGGPATNSQLAWPVGVAVDKAGVLYIADSSANTIRTVDKGGIIHTLAGNGTADYTGDGGAATAAALSSPSAVAVDRAGNVYIADTGNSVVRQVDKSGIIHTFAGSVVPGYAGDEGPATAAQLLFPSGVAVDGLGGVYIADSANNVIRYVEPASHTIHTLAGNGTGDFAGDGGRPTDAALALPAGVAEDDRLAVGDQFDTVTIYIADTLNNRVREIHTTPINVGPGR